MKGSLSTMKNRIASVLAVAGISAGVLLTGTAAATAESTEAGCTTVTVPTTAPGMIGSVCIAKEWGSNGTFKVSWSNVGKTDQYVVLEGKFDENWVGLGTNDGRWNRPIRTLIIKACWLGNPHRPTPPPPCGQKKA